MLKFEFFYFENLNYGKCTYLEHMHHYKNKKLSYRRETACQLHMSTRLANWPCNAQNTAVAEVVLFFDIQTLWFKKCWPKTDSDMK